MNYVTEPVRRTEILCEADAVALGGGPAGPLRRPGRRRVRARPTVLMGRWGDQAGRRES